MLAQLYRYADLAFVGGGFTRAGLHSILEPLAHQCAICFGPNTRQYEEAVDMLSTGSAEIVNDAGQLMALVLKLYNNPGVLQKMKEQNALYLQQSAGACQRILDKLDME